ncbi:MAG: lamin tail domain-containing protein [Candidatus Limnocylindrales bacterium]
MARARTPQILSARLIRLALTLTLAVPIAVGASVARPEAASAAPCVYISGARFDAAGVDAQNLNGEYVKVTNRCSRMIGIGGWRVKDRAGNRYTFASTVRMGKGTIYLHTGKGTNRPGHRYWGRTTPVWNNTGTETAYLINKAGTVVSKLTKTVAAATSPAPPTTEWPTAFGSRPQSGPIHLRGCHDLTISNKTFKDLGANVIAIRLQDCTNVTIRDVDFINVAEGVLAVDSTNIKVIDSRYQNILGPHERDGSNRGNFVQFDSVNGGLIDHNKGKGGDTEDVVSLYQTSNVIVEDNHFEGTNWSSSSGSGIALSDGGGSNNHARRNTLLNIGQVGIFIAGGTNNSIRDNVIYGEARPLSNVGIYVWNQSSATCSGNAVTGNRVYYLKPDGRTESGYWGGGGCGTVTMSGNDFRASLSLSSLRVVL